MHKNIAPFLVGMLCMPYCVDAQDELSPTGADGAVVVEKVATFSICAVDPATGECGGAVASMYPAVGRVVVHARPGVGVLCTQHYDRRMWADEALDMLADGTMPQGVLASLLERDDRPGMRQLALINVKGVTALHNPIDAPAGSSYWGAMAGRNYSCQGNTLNGPEVITAMSAAYEQTKGSLADRLMAAVIAGDCAGGDHRGRLGAGIRVCKVGHDGYWLELQVERSDDAVLELAKKYAELSHEAKGDWRGGELPFEHPCPNRPAPRAPGSK